MGISMRHVVWCSATLSLGAFFYVLTVEPMDQKRNPRAAAIDRVPSRNTLVVNIRKSLGQGQMLAADRQSAALLENYPEDLDAIYFRAIVELALGREDLVSKLWTMLDQQTSSLESWPDRYTDLGIAYYRAWALVGTGRVDEGQAMFRALADRVDQIPGAYGNEGLRQYNLACYRAMGGEPDDAMTHWSLAVDAGYGQDSGWWMVDPDLESLQKDHDRFWEIGSRLIQMQGERDRRGERRQNQVDEHPDALDEGPDDASGVELGG